MTYDDFARTIRLTIDELTRKKDITVKVRTSASSSSVYYTIRGFGWCETIRVSDHAQPEYGAFDTRRGYRGGESNTNYVFGTDSVEFCVADLKELFEDA